MTEQRSRELWRWPTVESLWADLKYALRQLCKAPGFATVAILSLALGIGATTSMFSLIYAVLLHPVPYADWQRLVYPIYFNDDQPTPQQRWFTLTWQQYQQLLKANSLESAVGDTDIPSEITGHDIPESVTLTYITENVGSFLRVPALIGRNIQPSDASVAAAGQAPVVLSYSFWMRRYNGDRNVLNQAIEIGHKPFTIVGVMPRDYAWEPDLYVPMSLLPTRERNILPVMKLKPGVTPAAADAEIGALLHQFAKADPQQWPLNFHLHLERITDRVIQNGGRAIALLAAAVLMLLLIGCANSSILLLARGITRQSELAIRSALGATRYRIVRQLLIEALLLATSGSLLGIAFAFWMARLIYGLFPDVFMHESVVRINLPILAFSIALALFTGLFFGLLPSLRISRPDVSQMVQAAGRKVTGGAAHARFLNTLIAAQIALTIVMMGAAGAAVAGFMRLAHRNLGYDPSHVMSVFIPLHPRAATRDERVAYFEALRQKIAAVPGVTQVGISINATPPYYGQTLRPFDILGSPAPQRQFLRAEFTDALYFSALHIPLLQGRLWDHAENRHGTPVAVINQAFARHYFPSGSIGRQIRVPSLKILPDDAANIIGDLPDTGGWMQIVGVVGDSLNNGLANAVMPTVYIPFSRLVPDYTQFLVRTQGPPLAALRSVQLAIASINPDQQTQRDVRDLQTWIDDQPEYQQQRLFSILFALFSALALALALVGLYSVVSYSVAQRTNEFGIRMALGAQRIHVLWIVARNIGITVASGLAAGLLIFLTLHKLLIHWTQNSEWSPLVLAAVAALFLLAAALACTVPALRAASIDPMQALRAE